MAFRFFILSCLFTLSSILLSGCANQPLEGSSSSGNLGNFIDVAKDSRLADIKIPLRLPASIAIVFVPSELYPDYKIPDTTLHLAAEKIKQQIIANPKLVRSATVVPTEEIKAKLSLQQIRELYDTDIAILLSYRQDRRNQQSGPAAFMDLLIIGNFFIPGIKTLTSTIIEGKVIHIPSNAIIFKTNGTDQRSIYSTRYGEKSAGADESIESLLAATTDFGNSLTKVLTKFENFDASHATSLSVLAMAESGDNRISRPTNDYWKSVNSYKASGGGAFGIIPLLIAIAVCFVARRK